MGRHWDGESWPQKQPVGGRRAPGRGSWPFSSLSSALQRSASCRAPAPSSRRLPEDREQQNTGIATPEELPVVTEGWIQIPGLIQYIVNYKINPLPSFVIKRAADWTCIFLALQNKAPELKNETLIVFDIKGIPTR